MIIYLFYSADPVSGLQMQGGRSQLFLNTQYDPHTNTNTHTTVHTPVQLHFKYSIIQNIIIFINHPFNSSSKPVSIKSFPSSPYKTNDFHQCKMKTLIQIIIWKNVFDLGSGEFLTLFVSQHHIQIVVDSEDQA